ncbi:MAG: hypothetical protein BGN97_02260 [Microbacterium sp. 69-10]|nr:MAG: hypothetical protein BGN97_02260 [Microbacterium sp. 69-10]
MGIRHIRTEGRGAALERQAQLLALPVRRALGRSPRRQLVVHLADLEQVLDALIGERPHDHSAVRYGRDEALTAEEVERLADRHPRHPQIVRKGLLHQPLPRLRVPRDDPLAQRVGDLPHPWTAIHDVLAGLARCADRAAVPFGSMLPTITEAAVATSRVDLRPFCM